MNRPGRLLALLPLVGCVIVPAGPVAPAAPGRPLPGPPQAAEPAAPGPAAAGPTALGPAAPGPVASAPSVAGSARTVRLPRQAPPSGAEAPWVRVFCADAERKQLESCAIRGKVARVVPAAGVDAASAEAASGLARYRGYWVELEASEHPCRKLSERARQPARAVVPGDPKLRVIVHAPAALESRMKQLLQRGTLLCGDSFRQLAGQEPIFEGHLEAPDGRPLLAFSDWHTAQSDLLPGFAFKPGRELGRQQMAEGYLHIDRDVVLLRSGKTASMRQGDEYHFAGETYWVRASAEETAGALPPSLRWQGGSGVHFQMLALER